MRGEQPWDKCPRCSDSGARWQGDQRGVSVFEAPKDTATTYEGIHVRLGGASTLQFQALDHENSGSAETPVLQEIGSNFNLATAFSDR